MKFTDIFRSSFLQEYSAELTTGAAAMYLAMAAVIGLYIFLIYRIITKRSFYSKSFNVSLWVLTVITASIIITVSSNIVISLGMVGALSIVRYRTAIKDPMDLVFLFWAIAEGIMCGAGMAVIGMVLALVITAGLVVLDKLPAVKTLKLMTISASGCEEEIMALVAKHCKIYRVKSRSLSVGQLSLVIEFFSENERQYTDSLMAVPQVYSVVTLDHDGEATF